MRKHIVAAVIGAALVLTGAVTFAVWGSLDEPVGGLEVGASLLVIAGLLTLAWWS